jgi:Tfp pilus assembly PilM family ATPase
MLAAGKRSDDPLPGKAATATVLGPAARGVYRAGEPDLHEPLETLTDEIATCLRYYESACPEKRVERTVFLGGESRQVALCQHVARAIRLPAQLADPLARVARSGEEPCAGADLSGNQPGWALALGLCLSPTDL